MGPLFIDIFETWVKKRIVCIYGTAGLGYVVISYRWGDLHEQTVKTPNFTAHITSFDVSDLIFLCGRIRREPDLNSVTYLWIDAISVDQYDHSTKKDTILKMNEIYKNATYILVVPDLHISYLWNNTENSEVIILVEKYKDIIHGEIFNHTKNSTAISDTIINTTNHHPVIQNLKEKIKKFNENELKKAYRFLAYLIDDWSNRTWVISEYYIAKEKYEQHGTPLKYIFLSLLTQRDESPSVNFFSHTLLLINIIIVQS